MISVNYFQLLDIPQSFEIDKQKLKQIFKQKAFQFHPDNNNDDTTLIYANLNDAYQNLISNSKRAFHLLKLQNIEINEDCSMNDFHFLESQLQWQEDLENASTVEQLENLQKILDQNVKVYCNQFRDTFSIDFAYKLQFLEKLELRLSQKFQDIDN